MAKTKVPKQIKVDMPSPPPERTRDVLVQEHNNLAFKLGQAQYQVYIMQREVDILSQQLQGINIEASKLPQEKPNE